MTETEQKIRTEMRIENRVFQLQQIENASAKAQNRPPAKIIAQEMPKGRHGQYSPNGNEIRMNRNILAAESPNKALKNYYHESRHAFQIDTIRHPERHPEISREVRQTWVENSRNYHRYNHKEFKNRLENNVEFRNMTRQQQARVSRKASRTIFEAYQNQALERDARLAAKDKMRAYREQAEIARQQKANMLREVRIERSLRELLNSKSTQTGHRSGLRSGKTGFSTNAVHTHSTGHDFSDGSIIHMGRSALDGANGPIAHVGHSAKDAGGGARGYGNAGHGNARSPGGHGGSPGTGSGGHGSR